MKKNKNVKGSEFKLGFMERKIYNQLYSTIEKVLKTSYEIYISFKNDVDILTYEQFSVLINEKLKGE